MNSVKAIIAASILIIIGLASVDARPVSGHSPSIYATPQINQPTIYEQDSMVVTETMHPNGHASSSRRPLNLGEHIEGTITVREWVQDDIKHIETVEADGAQRLEKEPLVRRSVPGEATTIVTKENDTITTHVIEADGSESSSIRTLDPEENSEDFVEIYDPINNYGSPYNKENLVRRSNNGVTTTRITDKNGWVTSLVKNSDGTKSSSIHQLQPGENYPGPRTIREWVKDGQMQRETKYDNGATVHEIVKSKKYAH